MHDRLWYILLFYVASPLYLAGVIVFWGGSLVLHLAGRKELSSQAASLGVALTFVSMLVMFAAALVLVLFGPF